MLAEDDVGHVRLEAQQALVFLLTTEGGWSQMASYRVLWLQRSNWKLMVSIPARAQVNTSPEIFFVIQNAP